MNEPKRNTLNQATGYLLEFQEAPYGKLCGCVSIPIPKHLDKHWDDQPEEWQKDMTRRLLQKPSENRMCLADCPKCHGLGLIQDNAERDNGEPKRTH